MAPEQGAPSPEPLCSPPQPAMTLAQLPRTSVGFPGPPLHSQPQTQILPSCPSFPNTHPAPRRTPPACLLAPRMSFPPSLEAKALAPSPFSAPQALRFSCVLHPLLREHPHQVTWLLTTTGTPGDPPTGQPPGNHTSTRERPGSCSGGVTGNCAPQNSYVDILRPNTSECHCIWRLDL